MTYRLSKYIAAIAVCASLAGCADGLTGPDVPSGDGMVTVTLKNSDGTRTEESDNSETLIKDVAVALYPQSYGDDIPAVALQKFEGIDKNGSATVQMKLTDEMVSQLFNGTSGAECKLYAVANVDMADIPDNATIAQLKGMAATSGFDSRKVQESFVMVGSGSAVYTEAGGNGSASGKCGLVRAAAKISLNVKLPGEVTDADGSVWVPAISGTGGMRVMLSNGVKTSVASPSDVIKPGEENYYSITMKEPELVRELPNSGDGSGYPYHIDVPFYTYPNQWDETPGEQHKTIMTLLVPWQKRGESQWNTYYYQVPVNNLTEIVSNYSYVVNLNVGMLGSLSPETPELLEDLSYRIVDWSSENIDVDIKDTRYLVVSPKTFEVDNEAEISFNYYSSHPVVIENIEMDYKRFNFYSNGNGEDVTFTIDKDKIDNANGYADNNSIERLCSYSVGQDALGKTVVKINHPLKIWEPYDALVEGKKVSLTGNEDNSLEKVKNSIKCYQPANPEENAYSPYVIRVTIRHADNSAYTETVTITQYPGMYIQAEENPGDPYNTGSSRTWVSTWLGGYFTYTPTPDKYGFVYVNPTYTYVDKNSNGSALASPFGYWKNDSDLGGVHGLTGSNKNPNTYVISVSVLDNTDTSRPYLIGDPRSIFTSNALNNAGYLDPTEDASGNGSWSVEADALYEGDQKRKIKYYYPTIESEATRWMIAPKIRVASSYGVSESKDKTSMRRRVASYQEQGCPAGRWRLPTYGELLYITTLSNKGVIPILFNGTYLTAQGPYKVDPDNKTVTKSTESTFSVRGIYDEWYWEQESDYVLQKNSSGGYDFTWGDVKRNATRSNTLINMYKIGI